MDSCTMESSLDRARAISTSHISASRSRHSQQHKQASTHPSSNPSRQRQRPVTRTKTFRPSKSLISAPLLVILLLSCCSFVPTTAAQPIVGSPNVYSDLISTPSEEQAELIDVSGPLLIDLSPQPTPWSYNNDVLTAPESELDSYLEDTDETYLRAKRQALADATSTSKDHSTSVSTSSSTSTSASTSASVSSSTTEKPTKATPDTKSSSSAAVVASTTSSGDIATATSTDADTPLPEPFDSNLGNNFTSAACPAFIKSFLAEPNFKACLPFSLLLQNSNSFFQAEKSIVRITQVLDATCSAPSTNCSGYLSAIAANLTSTAACAADYAAENPTVTSAYVGLMSYLPLYSASCLKNPSTGSYCFADAITNSTSVTDSYVYFLPLNMSLPASAQPTCNQCLKNTMAVFNAASANRSQAIADTYAGAAGQINVQCGPSFVAANVPAAVSGGSQSLQGPMVGFGSHGGLFALVMVLMVWLL